MAVKRVALGTGKFPKFGRFTVFAPYIEYNPHNLKLATLEVSEAMGATADMADILVTLKHQDHEIRIAAIHALQACVHQLNPTIVHKVLPMLQDVHPEVRKTALIVLGRGQEESTTQARIQGVCSCLQDDHPVVRRQALFALRHIGEKPSMYLEAVIDLLQDDDIVVKGTALHVLPCLLGAAQPGAQHLVNQSANEITHKDSDTMDSLTTPTTPASLLQDVRFRDKLSSRLVACLQDENADVS